MATPVPPATRGQCCRVGAVVERLERLSGVAYRGVVWQGRFGGYLIGWLDVSLEATSPGCFREALAGVERLVARWLAAADPAPLTVQTSGTSGDPKAVALSAAALTASAQATLIRLGGPGQWLLALPAHYVAGLQVLVRSVLAGTSPVVLAEHADLASAVGALTHERRYLAVVPTQLHRMLASPTETAALAGLDAVLLGGSAARPELLAEAHGRGVRVVTTYGMSETCGGCVYDGVPLDTVSVALSETGRVLISGPVLFDGYVDQPALTAEVLHEGRLHTPDLGRFDAAGRLEILGRADDVAVSGGVNVPLGRVESRVASWHPAIAQAASAGSSGCRMGCQGGRRRGGGRGCRTTRPRRAEGLRRCAASASLVAARGRRDRGTADARLGQGRQADPLERREELSWLRRPAVEPTSSRSR